MRAHACPKSGRGPNQVVNGSDVWKASGFASARSATIEIPINSTNLKRTYKCVVTDSAGQTAETREVKVLEQSSLAATASTARVALGEYATFACDVAGAGGAALSYQWEISRDGGATWKASSGTGATTARLRSKATATTVGYLYRCRVTASDGREATTAPVGFDLSSGPIIVTEPADFVGRSGDKASFTVAAKGDGLTYAWEYSRDGGLTWSASSCKTAKATCSLTASTNGRLTAVRSLTPVGRRRPHVQPA